MIEIVNKNICLADTKYIAHQCNCVSYGAAGLAKELFSRFPYSNIYANRKTEDHIPGDILIRGRRSREERLIINMLAQLYPGPPKYNNDSAEMREKYFLLCLEKIKNINDLQSIGFPFGIGCGLAGGNWDNYYSALNDFSKELDGVKVVLYRL